MLDKRDEYHGKRLKREQEKVEKHCERSRKTVMSISFYDDDAGEYWRVLEAFCLRHGTKSGKPQLEFKSRRGLKLHV